MAACGRRAAGAARRRDLEGVREPEPPRVGQPPTSGDEFRSLVRSLRNNHVDRIGAENRRVRTSAMDEAMEAVLPAADHTESRAAAHEVLAALAELPERYREVVVAVDIA